MEKTVRTFLRHYFVEGDQLMNHTFFALPSIQDAAPIVFLCRGYIHFDTVMEDAMTMLKVVLEFDCFCHEKGYNALSSLCFLYCNGVYRSMCSWRHFMMEPRGRASLDSLKYECSVYETKIKCWSYLGVPPLVLHPDSE